jgi:hypothetical protein
VNRASGHDETRCHAEPSRERSTLRDRQNAKSHRSMWSGRWCSAGDVNASRGRFCLSPDAATTGAVWCSSPHPRVGTRSLIRCFYAGERPAARAATVSELRPADGDQSRARGQPRRGVTPRRRFPARDASHLRSIGGDGQRLRFST